MSKKLDAGVRHSDLTQTTSSLTVFGVDIKNCPDIREANEGVWNMLSDQYKTPTSPALMVWNANNKIVELEETKHSVKERNRLNKNGIHIYLFEPMCSYYLDDPYVTLGDFNCGFYIVCFQ